MGSFKDQPTTKRARPILSAPLFLSFCPLLQFFWLRLHKGNEGKVVLIYSLFLGKMGLRWHLSRAGPWHVRVLSRSFCRCQSACWGGVHSTSDQHPVNFKKTQNKAKQNRNEVQINQVSKSQWILVTNENILWERHRTATETLFQSGAFLSHPSRYIILKYVDLFFLILPSYQRNCKFTWVNTLGVLSLVPSRSR